MKIPRTAILLKFKSSFNHFLQRFKLSVSEKTVFKNLILWVDARLSDCGSDPVKRARSAYCRCFQLLYRKFVIANLNAMQFLKNKSSVSVVPVVKSLFRFFLSLKYFNNFHINMKVPRTTAGTILLECAVCVAHRSPIFLRLFFQEKQEQKLLWLIAKTLTRVFPVPGVIEASFEIILVAVSLWWLKIGTFAISSFDGWKWNRGHSLEICLN
jgi:hypothetical protein